MSATSAQVIAERVNDMGPQTCSDPAKKWSCLAIAIGAIALIGGILAIVYSSRVDLTMHSYALLSAGIAGVAGGLALMAWGLYTIYKNRPIKPEPIEQEDLDLSGLPDNLKNEFYEATDFDHNFYNLPQNTYTPRTYDMNEVYVMIKTPDGVLRASHTMSKSKRTGIVDSLKKLGYTKHNL